MAFWSVVLEELLAGLKVRWGKGWVYPSYYLDGVERRCHAKYVVHSDGQVERTGAIEVRTVLFHSSQQVLAFCVLGQVLQHPCIGESLTL